MIFVPLSKGDDLKNSMTRKLVIPAGDSALRVPKRGMKLKDYDFARVLINGQAIAGNFITPQWMTRTILASFCHWRRIWRLD
ncbi:hypothetical protein O9929_24235 [Vibrio lentus]|nr:hypothetical protein [Vibrio lentus]